MNCQERVKRVGESEKHRALRPLLVQEEQTRLLFHIFSSLGLSGFGVINVET